MIYPKSALIQLWLLLEKSGHAYTNDDFFISPSDSYQKSLLPKIIYFPPLDMLKWNPVCQYPFAIIIHTNDY